MVMVWGLHGQYFVKERLRGCEKVLKNLDKCEILYTSKENSGNNMRKKEALRPRRLKVVLHGPTRLVSRGDLQCHVLKEKL